MTLCVGHKKDGSPCGLHSIKGGTVCHKHGGSAPQVKAKAQQRLLMAADQMAAVMVDMANDEEKPPATRVTAAKDVMDRAGLKPVEQVEVTTVDTAVVDAEIHRLMKEMRDKLK